MREILFRGKRLDNGAWVTGDLVSGWKEFPPALRMHTGDLMVAVAEVDPATVGQYTGLKDKNGKRIFEGDLVRYYERQIGGEDWPVIQPVGYEEGGFCVHRCFLNNWLRNAINGNIQLEGIEVIGNVHDKPELLKDGDTP